jgi:NAD(P)-dependent dehydrogenase (short-subunit alcohol dehydrogenase family)
VVAKDRSRSTAAVNTARGGELEIAGISALVTGGISGLGLATAKALRQAGAASVVAVDLPSDTAESTAAEFGLNYVAADVTDEAQFRDALDTAAAAGPVRAVVHCAGRGGDRRRILDKEGHASPVEDFAEVIRVNLVGTYNVLRLSAERMAANEERDGDRGAIVLTASVAAFEGQIGQTSYSAAKAGVHAMTLVAARDLASVGIRVNTIAPGTFLTPMLGRVRPEIRDSLAATIPHPKRLGDPAQYARMALELIGNSYVNGETVRLDGAIRMAPR